MSKYVETWKGIAAHLERSDRWCQYMARREEDPLPVFKVGGRVRLDLDDYESWVARQKAGSQLGRGQCAA